MNIPMILQNSTNISILMVKRITLFLLLVSMMIPMTLSAQREKKEALTKGVVLNGNQSSLLRKNVPAPTTNKKQMLKMSPLIKGSKSMRRAPKAAPSADALTWDFESADQFNDWTTVDSDGDGFNWQYFNNTGLETGRMTAHGGEGLVASASYDNDSSTPLTPDNWLISPEVTLGGVLSLWACGQSEDYCDEVFGVFVCVGNSTDPADFVQVGSDKTATGSYVEYEFDLSQYAGQTGRFAIRHYKVTDMFWLNIDDVCLDINATYVPDPTDPTNLTADPAATTADVAWGGAEGDSWNLRYKVYNPNEKQTFLWDLTIDNYESQIDGWAIYDADEDGNNWNLTLDGYDPTGTLGENENVCFYSASWDNTTGALTPDNWLITPELLLGGTFKFRAKTSYYPDVLGVYVMTAEGEFQLGEDITPPSGEWQEYSFDTSEYDGQTGYIAIRHYNCEDQLRVYVDYISYEKEGDEPAEWIEVSGLTDPNYTIEGLEPGTDYMVEVQAYNEKGATEWTEPTYFTTGIDVSVSAAGYATLYYGDKNLVVPEGVEASAITVESGSMTQSQVYTAGDIIPQGTGVLLQASEGDYVFGVTAEEGTAPTDNMLRGSDEEEETTGGDIYLMLSLNEKSDPASVGFYYGADGGAAFTNGAHKAYLALTTEQAAGAKRVWFDTTGISSIKTVENNSQDVYTVTGVQVNKSSNMPKGIYIVGGKKVVVK